MFILTIIKCLLWGHEFVQQTDRDHKGRIERIRLCCIHCTKQTPGWSLKSQRSITGGGIGELRGHRGAAVMRSTRAPGLYDAACRYLTGDAAGQARG